MIDFISGELWIKEPTRAVILTGGVGYEIFIPYSTYLKLGEKNSPVRLLTHLIHRELSMELFGFYSEIERDLFRKLIGVSGIGPKTALSVLSGMDTADFIYAVSSGEFKYLTKISGIGAKTAQRLVMELKDSLKDIVPKGEAVSLPVLQGEKAALSVLLALGYKEPDAISAIRAVMKKHDLSESPVEEIVKYALKEI